MRYGRAFSYRAWVISFNSRLVGWTTFFLIAFGTVCTFLLEYNQTLAEHATLWGKIVSAFFTGTSSRTTGFNASDMGAVTFPPVMLMIFLMWVGSSPVSRSDESRVGEGGGGRCCYGWWPYY